MTRALKPSPELRVRRIEHRQTARLVPREISAVVDHVERRPALLAGLSQRERAAIEFEVGERRATSAARIDIEPVQPSGDHQMKDQPMIALEADRDALAETREPGHSPA